jgi:hypothetical protein
MKHQPFGLMASLIVVLAAGCGGDNSSSAPAAPIAINEVMPANKATCADELGKFADWIELYNNEATAIDLGGYSLTDSPAAPRKAVLAAGVSIPAKGVLVLWADGEASASPLHLPFKLSKAGEEILLFDPSGKQLDTFTWTAAQSDLSYARAPDGTGAIAACAHPTCGTVNGSSCAK